MNKNKNFLLAKLLQNDRAPNLKDVFSISIDIFTMQEIFTIYETEVVGHKDFEYTFYNIFATLSEKDNSMVYILNVIQLWIIVLNSRFIKDSLYVHDEIIFKTTVLYGKYSCEFRFGFTYLNWQNVVIQHFCFYDFLLINMALNVKDLKELFKTILKSASETPERFKHVTKSDIDELRVVLFNIYVQSRMLLKDYVYEGPQNVVMIDSKSQFVYLEDFFEYLKCENDIKQVLTNMHINSKRLIQIHDTQEALWFADSNYDSVLV